MKILLILLIVLLPNSNLFLQDIPDCMCPPLTYPRTGELTNQDSNCVIDTCGIWYPSANCDSAYWNNYQSEFGEEAKKRVYGKRFWEILFTVPAIPIPPVPEPDTIIYVDWTAIDTTYPEIRNTFQKMEENFGDFYFRKLSPTADENAKRFRLYFTNYVNIDTITKIGRNTTGIIVFDFVGWPYRSYDYHAVENYDNEDIKIHIYPNPVTDYLYIHNQNYNYKGKIIISSVTGEVLLTIEGNNEEEQKINIQSLSPGIYFLRIGDVCKKLIVNR